MFWRTLWTAGRLRRFFLNFNFCFNFKFWLFMWCFVLFGWLFVLSLWRRRVLAVTRTWVVVTFVMMSFRFVAAAFRWRRRFFSFTFTFCVFFRAVFTSAAGMPITRRVMVVRFVFTSRASRWWRCRLFHNFLFQHLVESHHWWFRFVNVFWFEFDRQFCSRKVTINILWCDFTIQLTEQGHWRFGFLRFLVRRHHVFPVCN